MGGRASVRTALYMPTLTAIRHNPPLQACYQRLIGRGRPAKVAITGLQAQAPGHPQCHPARPNTMAKCLTPNTVAQAMASDMSFSIRGRVRSWARPAK
jgi:hypothetical protein